MHVSGLVFDPRFRWEPGCEFLLSRSDGPLAGPDEIEADGAHGAGDGGVEGARGILVSGRLFADSYGDGIPHAFWHAAVWDAGEKDARLQYAGGTDMPSGILAGLATPGESTWVAVGLTNSDEGGLLSVWSQGHGTQEEALSAASGLPGTALVMRIERMEP